MGEATARIFGELDARMHIVDIHLPKVAHAGFDPYDLSNFAGFVHLAAAMIWPAAGLVDTEIGSIRHTSFPFEIYGTEIAKSRMAAGRIVEVEHVGLRLSSRSVDLLADLVGLEG